MTIRATDNTPVSAGASTRTAETPSTLARDFARLSPTERAAHRDAGQEIILAASPCGAWSPGAGFSCVQGTNHQGRNGWFWTLS